MQRVRDPYDVRVAFDDVFGAPTVLRGGLVPYIPGIGVPGIPIVGGRDVTDIADVILREPRNVDDIVDLIPRDPHDVSDLAAQVSGEIRKRRFGSPIAHAVLGCDVDTTEWSFEPQGRHVVGADRDVAEGEYPLFDLLRVRFQRAIGKPKLVRVDDQETYEIFRTERRQPYLASLDSRLTRLEREVAEHVSDDHGHGRVSRLEEELLSHIDDSAAHLKPQPPYDFVGAFVDETLRGGQRIALDLPPSARGKVECWVDEDEVLVSARLPQGIATTGAPFAPELMDLVGCAESLGCCGLEALLLGCHLAPKTAGRALLGTLCGVAPDLSGLGVFELRPKADAGMSAAMALLQRCQRGDRRACREALSLAHGAGRRLMAEARARLVRGQAAKAREQ